MYQRPVATEGLKRGNLWQYVVGIYQSHVCQKSAQIHLNRGYVPVMNDKFSYGCKGQLENQGDVLKATVHS